LLDVVRSLALTRLNPHPRQNTLQSSIVSDNFALLSITTTHLLNITLCQSPHAVSKASSGKAHPTGRLDKLAQNDAYVTGDNSDKAVLLIHDLLGWTFPNIRLLADHYAQEVDATVYVPDFFGGEVLPSDPINKLRWHEVDVPGFMKKNCREIRGPEIFECARALRAKYKKVGAVGFCYGGWAVFRLGVKEH
jgi:dienelactone hydrolase